MRPPRHFKVISRILILAILHLCWLTSYGWAEMIPTESAIEKPSQVETDRQRLLDLLNREEVVIELKKYGISKVEAVARMNSLSDEEVIEISGRLNELPEGGNVALVVAGALVLAILLVAYTLELVFKGIYCIFADCKESIFKPFWRPDGGGEEEEYDIGHCYSRCHSTASECINSEKIEKSKPQCEEDKQACFQQCEVEQEERLKEYDHGSGIFKMQSNLEYIFYVSPTYSLDKVENYYLEWSCKKAEFYKSEKIAGRITVKDWEPKAKEQYCFNMLSALHKALSERFPEWQENKDAPDIKIYAELEGVQAYYPPLMYVKIIRWDTVVAEYRFKRTVFSTYSAERDPTSPTALRKNAEEIVQFIADPESFGDNDCDPGMESCD